MIIPTTLQGLIYVKLMKYRQIKNNKQMKTTKDSDKKSVVLKKVKTIKKNPLSKEMLGKINAYWRAANYLSVGQLYLHENPLLKEPLMLSHIKNMLLGHGVPLRVKISFMYI